MSAVSTLNALVSANVCLGRPATGAKPQPCPGSATGHAGYGGLKAGLAMTVVGIVLTAIIIALGLSRGDKAV